MSLKLWAGVGRTKGGEAVEKAVMVLDKF